MLYGNPIDYGRPSPDAPPRILLVEDDEVDYLTTSRILQKIYGQSYQVDWSRDIASAKILAHSRKHDLYLIDFYLDHEPGLSLIEYLRSIKPNCYRPIILLTGRDDLDTDRQAMSAGANDYLVKGEINDKLLERSIRYSIKQKQAENAAIYLAYHDNLTHLPNWLTLRETMEQAVEEHIAREHYGALLFIDCDHFKKVNDSMGHNMGDELITALAKRLKNICFPQGVTMRYSGDCFAMFLPMLSSDPDHAEELATRQIDAVNQALDHPFHLGEDHFFVSVCVGAKIFPENLESAETAIKHADIALHWSRRSGPRNHNFFESGMEEAVQQELMLETELRQALLKNQLELHFQPIMRMETERASGLEMLGAEALLRWNHPEYGYISPEKAVQIAEHTGLITPLGNWVLSETCRILPRLPEECFVTVNVSAVQLQTSDFALDVLSICDKTETPPERIIFEITETSFLVDEQTAVRNMKTLKDRGFRFALDDFGQGYASLSYLKSYEFDILKIDREFITDIPRNRQNTSICRAIVKLCQDLELTVIAEGLEEREQYDFFSKIGCQSAQGFLLGRPAPWQSLCG